MKLVLQRLNVRRRYPESGRRLDGAASVPTFNIGIRKDLDDATVVHFPGQGVRQEFSIHGF